MNGGGGGIILNGGTKSNNHKTKVLRNLKVMIFKFCTVRHSILIFIKRILRPPPPPELSELSNECYSTVYTKSPLDLVGELF